jgi:succinate dehydrogenase/fumarate reductase flavoprotein subunit
MTHEKSASCSSVCAKPCVKRRSWACRSWRADLTAFLNLTRSLPAAWHVTRRFTRHLLDLAVHGRAMQLVNGVALVARLAKSAEDLGVLLWESAPVTELLRENNQVHGAVVSTTKGSVRIHARKAVVLAAGGFANDIERRKALFPRRQPGVNTWPCHRWRCPATGCDWAKASALE